MNQDHNFSADNVYDFLKLLIEIGGVHYVDKDRCIFRSDDGTPVGVKIGNGKDNIKQIALFKEGCKPPENAVYLNPFDELLGQHPERDWFMNVISIIPGCLVLHSMKTMADLVNNKTKDTKFKTAEVLSEFTDRIDKKFETELQKIRPLDAGMIFYDKQKHVAQLLCDFWQEDYIKKMETKIRKGSITLIQDMAARLYGTKTPEEITYTATILACPKFDAIAHVLVDTLSRLSNDVEKIAKIDLHTKELKEHLTHMEAYHKALQWLATSSTTSAKSTSEIDNAISGKESIPWNITPVANPSALPTNVTPVGAVSNPLANAMPVGGVINPTFGCGVTHNPNFGLGGFLNNVVDPGIPGLGRVTPVLPRLDMPDFSKMATDTFNGMHFSGLDGGFGHI